MEISNQQFEEILKQIEQYKADLIFQYEQKRNIVHVFWDAPMAMQIGAIEYSELLKEWYFVPNGQLPKNNSRQLVAMGYLTNGLNRATHGV